MPSVKRRWLKTTLSRAATTFDRTNRAANLLLLTVFCAAAIAMPGCAGITSTGPAVVDHSLAANTGKRALSQSQQFQAIVTGTSNKSVTWFAGGVAGGSVTAGTISPSGLYTAPSAMPSPPTVTVTASSNADSSCHSVCRRHAHRRNRNRDLAHFRHGVNRSRTSVHSKYRGRRGLFECGHLERERRDRRQFDSGYDRFQRSCKRASMSRQRFRLHRRP